MESESRAQHQKLLLALELSRFGDERETILPGHVDVDDGEIEVLRKRAAPGVHAIQRFPDILNPAIFR
jgi:hypothetical protein